MFIDSNAAITISLPETPPINAAAVQPLDADAKKKQLVENFLSDALNKKNGYTVYVEEGDKLPDTGNASEVVKRFVDLVENGRPVGVSIPNSSYCWKVDSKKKLEELVFSVTDNKDLLPNDRQKGLLVVKRLKKKDIDIHFFSKQKNNIPIQLGIGPLWLAEQGSLWASIGIKGKKIQVNDLYELAKGHGVDPDALVGNKSTGRKEKMQMVTLAPIVITPINITPSVVSLEKAEENNNDTGVKG